MPDVFVAAVHYLEEMPLLDIAGIFLALINVAYRLSEYGFRKTWTGIQNEYLHMYPVGVTFGPPTKRPSGTVPNRFILWGLWKTAIEIYKDRVFKPCAAALVYNREYVAHITVEPGSSGKVTPAMIEAEDDDAESSTAMSISPSDAVSPLQAGGLLIRYGFGDQTLSSLDVFLAAFPALTFAAEKGVNAPCHEFRQYGYSTSRTVGVSIQAVRDERGKVKLKYDHVRKAVKRTIWGMVKHKKFRSMRFWLELDGEKIATGEWVQKQGEVASSANGRTAIAKG